MKRSSFVLMLYRTPCSRYFHVLTHFRCTSFIFGARSNY